VYRVRVLDAGLVPGLRPRGVVSVWISGPKRDRTDTRYGPSNPEIEPEAVETYHAFLEGAPLLGRENG
jgi:hypothetical protein